MSTMMAPDDQFEAVSAFPTVSQTKCVGPRALFVAGWLQWPEGEKREWVGLFDF